MNKIFQNIQIIKDYRYEVYRAKALQEEKRTDEWFQTVYRNIDEEAVKIEKRIEDVVIKIKMRGLPQLPTFAEFNEQQCFTLQLNDLPEETSINEIKRKIDEYVKKRLVFISTTTSISVVDEHF